MGGVWEGTYEPRQTLKQSSPHNPNKDPENKTILKFRNKKWWTWFPIINIKI